MSSGGPPPSKARGPPSSLSVQGVQEVIVKAFAKPKPPNAPIVLAIYKYTSEASDLLTSFRPDEPLWAIRVEHNAWPSVTPAAIAASNAFLADLHAGDSDMPKNLQELRQKDQIVLQLGRADIDNPDRLPIEQYSLVYYIGGTLEKLRNAIHFLVEFFYHRCTHPVPGVDNRPWPAPADIAVHLHPRTGINLEGLDTERQRMSRGVACVASVRASVGKGVKVWAASLAQATAQAFGPGLSGLGHSNLKGDWDRGHKSGDSPCQ